MKALKAANDARPRRGEKRRRAEAAAAQQGPMMPLPELAGRHALATLPEQMALATEWFKFAGTEDALVLAEDILQSWTQLRKTLAASG